MRLTWTVRYNEWEEHKNFTFRIHFNLYFRQRTYKVNQVCRVVNWILCEDTFSDYWQDGLSECRGKQRRHVNVSVCVSVYVRACVRARVLSPRVFYSKQCSVWIRRNFFVRILWRSRHRISLLTTLLDLLPPRTWLSLSLSVSLTHTHTHTITSPPFVTNVGTLSSEGKLYLRPSTIPQRHYKASGDKA